MLKEIKLWFLRWKVIPNEKSKELGLRHCYNIYGDSINRLNCRSIWVDKKGRSYRVEELVYPEF